MTAVEFKRATAADLDTIFKWLAEPHMVEFWDNSQEHRDDIINFVHGRKQTYFAGTFVYWIGSMEDKPFCFVLSDCFDPAQDMPDVIRKNLSERGHTIGLDFGIGDTSFLGKGLAAASLVAFMKFYNESVDPQADTFVIDPDEGNPRARHVYEQAGFQMKGSFLPTQGDFIGQATCCMVKRL